jgi:signal transduction histidine kinase
MRAKITIAKLVALVLIVAMIIRIMPMGALAEVFTGYVFRYWHYIDFVLISVAFVILVVLFAKIRKTERMVAQAKARELELQAENELLDRMSRMRAEFFQNMSHELKTPMTVISNCVNNVEDMMDFDNIGDYEMRECLVTAQREIMRMVRMVDGAINQSRDTHDMESVDLGRLLKEGTKVYHPVLERQGNTLIVHVSETLPLVYANEDMLINVIANLLSNANKHTHNGEIQIYAAEGDGEVSVTVRDNGSEISPDILPHIFERGVTIGGTGLGLPICKQVIEEVHKGTISVESEEGKGTAFTFTIPLR